MRGRGIGRENRRQGNSDLLVNLPLASGLGGKVAGAVAFSRSSAQWGLGDPVPGPELVLNGGFDSASNWNTQAGWSVSGGVMAGVAVPANNYFYQAIGMLPYTTYQITYTISGYVSGLIRAMGFPNTNGISYSANGTYTETFTTDGAANGNFGFQTGGIGCTMNIDNVSLRQLTPGIWTQVANNVPFINAKGVLVEPASANKCTCYGAIPSNGLGAELNNGVWTATAGWAATGSGAAAVMQHTPGGGTTSAYRWCSPFIGRVFSITYTITGRTQGSLTVGGMLPGTARTSNGTFTDRGMCLSEANVNFLPTTDFDGTISNVSVKESTEQLGAELIVGSLTTGTGTTVTNTDATHLVAFSGGGMRYQSDTTSPVLTVTFDGTVLTAGKVYRLTATCSAAGLKVTNFGGAGYLLPSGSDSFDLVCTASGVFTMQRSTTNVDVTLSALSVKEVLYAVGTQTLYYSGAWRQNHTNMTLSGDTAATLTTVDDSAALTAAGLQNICPSFKVYKLDNSLGVGQAMLTVGGVTGNTNAHSLSCFVRGNTGYLLRLDYDNWASPASVVSPSYVLLKKENAAAPGAGSTFGILAGAGCITYAVVPQLEELPFATSPMPTAGASASRAGTALTIQAAGNLPANDFTVVTEYTPISMAPGSFPKIWTANDGAGQSVCQQTNGTTLSLYAQRQLTGPLYKTTGGYTLTLGNKYRMAVVMSSTVGVRQFCNGLASTPNADNTTVACTGTMTLADYISSVAYLRNFRIYKRALSDAKCIALTS